MTQGIPKRPRIDSRKRNGKRDIPKEAGVLQSSREIRPGMVLAWVDSTHRAGKFLGATPRTARVIARIGSNLETSAGWLDWNKIKVHGVRVVA